jgi:hypothetical protein
MLVSVLVPFFPAGARRGVRVKTRSLARAPLSPSMCDMRVHACTTGAKQLSQRAKCTGGSRAASARASARTGAKQLRQWASASRHRATCIGYNNILE